MNRKAGYDLAERFRCPVFVVTDKELAMSLTAVDADAFPDIVVRIRRALADYTDVLTLAHLFSQFVRADNMEVQLESVPASRNLQIGTSDLMPILDESREQINSLRRALGK